MSLFELPPEYEELRQSVRRLAQDRVQPRASEIDTTQEYPQDLFDLFVENGLMGLVIPEQYGGGGAGILGLVVAIEEVAKYSNAAALMLLLSRLPTGPLLMAGSEEQRETYVRPIANGSQRAAFCLSEPQAGSDVMGMRTSAAADGDGWILNGTKCWISGIEQADWYCVFAKTADPQSRAHDSISAFIVPRSTAGVSVGHIDEKMGVKGVATGELLLENVHLGAESLVGEVGGFKLAMLGLNAMRPVVAARGIGVAERSLMYAVEYVKNRPAFGKTIADMQGVQWKIAEMATEIEAARLLTYRAAVMADEGKFGKEFVPYLSMAKYYTTELAVRTTGECLQMLGAAGYMRDHPLEMYYRDARQLTIVEGTSQIQLQLISRGVLDHDLWWD